MAGWPSRFRKDSFLISFSSKSTLVVAAVLGLGACQMDEMVTSVNPIFQSDQSRELREVFGNATLVHKWQAGQHRACEPQSTSRRSVIEYSTNGTYKAYLECRGAAGTSPLRMVFEGSWNIRGDQYCENITRLGGDRPPPELREVRCLPAAVSENTITRRGTVFRAVSSNRYQEQ